MSRTSSSPFRHFVGKFSCTPAFVLHDLRHRPIARYTRVARLIGQLKFQALTYEVILDGSVRYGIEHLKRALTSGSPAAMDASTCPPRASPARRNDERAAVSPAGTLPMTRQSTRWLSCCWPRVIVRHRSRLGSGCACGQAAPLAARIRQGFTNR